MKNLLITGLALFFLFAHAQIGEPTDALLEQLSEYTLTETETGFTLKNGFTVTTETRGDLLATVSGEGILDEANQTFVADLIGAATGYGTEISEPVKEFFSAQLSELAGQGPVDLAVQQYTLGLTVTGEEAPFEVSYTLSLQELPEDAFPTTAHTLGPDDATYVIREFSDFQCPFCARFVEGAFPLIEEELLARGDVRFEFHHFPLQSIHANAFPAAEASECVTAANDAEAFWAYHDALFERQQAWSSLGDPNSYFVRLAGDIGLETEGVESCLAERTYADDVTAAYEAAGSLGLSGTPSVFLNGFKVGDFTTLESYLDLMSLSDAFAGESGGGE